MVLATCAGVLLAGGAAAQSAPEAAAKPAALAPTVAVFQLNAERVETSVAKLVTDTLVGEVRRAGNFSRVLASSDMDALLGLERQKQMMSCSLDNCMAELAGALGTDYLLAGSIGELGGTYLVNLKLLDVRRAMAVAVVNRRSPSQGTLPDTAIRAGYDLLAEAKLLREAVEPPAPQPATPVAAAAPPPAGTGAKDGAREGASGGSDSGGPSFALIGAGAAALGVGLAGLPLTVLMVVAAVLTVVLPYFVLYVPTPGLPYAARAAAFPVGAGALGVVAGVVFLAGLGLGAAGVALLAKGFMG
ncbi:MAG: hypothetical protein HY904_15385 [Deltaproteobacteria bacterium]|nr:hypothetical protein [Deltaproteobacteria bacterium]